MKQATQKIKKKQANDSEKQVVGDIMDTYSRKETQMGRNQNKRYLFLDLVKVAFVSS